MPNSKAKWEVKVETCKKENRKVNLQSSYKNTNSTN